MQTAEALTGFKFGEGVGVLVACQLPPGLDPFHGPESQLCVLGSWLCARHPWVLCDRDTPCHHVHLMPQFRAMQDSEKVC